MEYQRMSPNLTAAEGFVLGVGAKMFTIAGPVIVYGFIYWTFKMLTGGYRRRAVR